MIRLLMLIIIMFTVAYVMLTWPFDQEDIPTLKTGDLVVQLSTRSKQSAAVMVATQSVYSHIGLIDVKPDGTYYVVEAADAVQETPLKEWIKEGLFHRFAVYRDTRLSDVSRMQMVKAAKRYLGREYDKLFLFDNEDIYCSELVKLAYDGISKSVGRIQPLSSLHVDNGVVKHIAKERWTGFPFCDAETETFEDCWDKILDIDVISPQSIIETDGIERIYTNYRKSS